MFVFAKLKWSNCFISTNCMNCVLTCDVIDFTLTFITCETVGCTDTTNTKHTELVAIVPVK